jgi:hypothetical protein
MAGAQKIFEGLNSSSFYNMKAVGQVGTRRRVYGRGIKHIGRF